MSLLYPVSEEETWEKAGAKYLSVTKTGRRGKETAQAG